MIARRTLLAVAAAGLVLPRAVRAAPSRLTLSGMLEQGALVVGNAPAGTKLSLDGTSLHVSPAGQFAFGFAFDQTKAAALAAIYADGSAEAQNVIPAIRQYEIQRIMGLPEKFVTLPAEVLERRKRETAMIAEARDRDSDGEGFAQPFDWPAAGIISGTYGSQRILNGAPRAPHLGVDIAAAAGTPIRAPASAVVSLAEPDFYLEGGLTILDHGHGVSTCYLHQSKQMVKAGDAVERGQIVGLVGMTGRATGPHVHWGLNWFHVALDPSCSTRTPAPPRA
jgi:murein DD-endopeptidase MepM/ murein hydrolase activator NlpD